MRVFHFVDGDAISEHVLISNALPNRFILAIRICGSLWLIDCYRQDGWAPERRMGANLHLNKVNYDW